MVKVAGPAMMIELIDSAVGLVGLGKPVFAGCSSVAVSTAAVTGVAVGVGVGVGVGALLLLTTVSAQLLLVSLLSMITLLGSTEQPPPLRGFANVPAAVGVAVNDMSNEPPAAIVALLPKPETGQVRLKEPSIAQLMVKFVVVTPD